MGFKEIADLDCEKTTALGGVDKKSGKTNPTTITGYYIGTRDVASPKSKGGVAKLHVFQTKNGNVGVWGKTNLDQKMLGVQPGVLTKVDFTGMVQTKNNPMYKYRVACDESQQIEVNTAAPEAAEDEAGANAGAEDFSNDAAGYDDPEEAGLEDEEPAADEITPPRSAPPKSKAAAPSPERRAAVQNLLNGRSKRA